MANSSNRFFDKMHHIGSPQNDSAGIHGTQLKVNSHIHLPPNFSAFETIEQAVALSKSESIGVLGASNYYDYSIYNEFADLCVEAGIFPLFGLEIIALIDDLRQAGVKINDPGNPGKMYICGKGITYYSPMSDDANKLLQVIRDNDSKRMAAITGKLAEIFNNAGFDTHLDEEGIKDRIVKRHGCSRDSVYLQERHIAQAFQEVLFENADAELKNNVLEHLFGSPDDNPVKVQNLIRSNLMKAGKPAFIEDTFVDFDHAYRLILALGGIPCYPVLADGVAPICPYEEEIDRLIEDLKSRGIYAMEFIPTRNSPELLSEYVHKAHKAGMIITAGTEHNTLDLIPIEPACIDNEPIPTDVKEIFWEGACVVAAHQYLSIHGQTGYVDAHGNLNASYQSSKDRIKAFRELGESVISQLK